MENEYIAESLSEEKCNGLIGVPITFLDKFCPEQFELIGVANHGSDSKLDLFKPILSGKEKFKRLIIKRK